MGEISVIAIRGLLTLLLTCGALAALIIGFWMYINDPGHKRDHLVLEYDKWKVTARTVGAVLMVTSFIWAGLAVWAAPTYKKSADGMIHVANSGYELKAKPITICSSIPFASLKSDPNALVVCQYCICG
jgi:hypothetical protein